MLQQLENNYLCKTHIRAIRRIDRKTVTVIGTGTGTTNRMQKMSSMRKIKEREKKVIAGFLKSMYRANQMDLQGQIIVIDILIIGEQM